MTEPAFHWARSQIPDFETGRIVPLRAEASFRTFYRLEALEGQSVVLMISPPEKEQNEQFERLSILFSEAGIPVPVILAAERSAGWYLMTDLGRRELADAYGTPDERAGLEAALHTLIELQDVSDPVVPPYATDRFRDELGIFSEWFVGGFLEISLPERLEPVFGHLVERMAGQHQCCVHRDYHCRNLLFDPETGALGVVDFQDALMGPVSYDLASLLHDCYHRFSEQDVTYWRDWYLSRSPLALDPARFTVDLTMTAVQRQLKAVGIFTRLKLRDGKTTHLGHILPVLESLGFLSRSVASLAPLADWLAALDHDLIRDRVETLRAREAEV
jgi:aminoglycoside/choline kinase family phosphotransferase